MSFKAWYISICFILSVFFINSCKNDEAQTMLFEEEITTLIIRVSNCSNDPLCPIKTPEINSSVKIFEYLNEPEPNDAFLLQTGKTDISGTYQTSALEGNNYYFIRVETTDGAIQELLIRLDATTTKVEEFLFP